MERASSKWASPTDSANFGYWRDPLFWVGCGLYALNRWGLKPHSDNWFLHDYFNDVWFIPCALPLTLWVQRILGLRNHDRPPGVGEIFFHLAVWSVLAEAVAPHFMKTTGDPWDVAAYTGGAIIGLAWWQRARLLNSRS
jgi:hypothetical protein